MIDLGLLGMTGVSTIVAGVAASASAISFVRDLFRKTPRPNDTPTSQSKPDEGASVLVQTPDGQSTRVRVTIEEANRLLHR